MGTEVSGSAAASGHCGARDRRVSIGVPPAIQRNARPICVAARERDESRRVFSGVRRRKDFAGNADHDPGGSCWDQRSLRFISTTQRTGTPTFGSLSRLPMAIVKSIPARACGTQRYSDTSESWLSGASPHCTGIMPCEIRDRGCLAQNCTSRGVEHRPFDAGAAVVPAARGVADLLHATEADADAAGHRAFQRNLAGHLQLARRSGPWPPSSPPGRSRRSGTATPSARTTGRIRSVTSPRWPSEPSSVLSCTSTPRHGGNPRRRPGTRGVRTP